MGSRGTRSFTGISTFGTFSELGDDLPADVGVVLLGTPTAADVLVECDKAACELPHPTIVSIKTGPTTHAGSLVGMKAIIPFERLLSHGTRSSHRRCQNRLGFATQWTQCFLHVSARGAANISTRPRSACPPMPCNPS